MRVAKIIQVTAGLTSLVAWFSSTALFMHFDAVNPTAPDVSSGAIYGQANHGHVVYLTAAEKHAWYALMALAGVLFLITAVISVRLALAKRGRP